MENLESGADAIIVELIIEFVMLNNFSVGIPPWGLHKESIQTSGALININFLKRDIIGARQTAKIWPYSNSARKRVIG